MKEINKSIEMVAVTDKDGTIKPIRFRIITENEEMQVIKIKGLRQTEDIKIGNDKARKFTCLIELNERQRLCEITYILASSKWYLYKM